MTPPFNANSLAEPHRSDPLRRGPGGQPLVNNPRDNLVTIIAVVTGDEAFQDLNGNGVWDDGEDFTDLTEPFVDANDDGTWDPGELFLDLNKNNSWDGKNGRWDRDTQIWVAERVLWTGEPAAEDRAAPEPVVALVPGSLQLSCPSSAAGSPCAQAAAVSPVVYIADPWFNAPARHGTADGCTLAAADPNSPVRMSVSSDAGPVLTYGAGQSVSLTVSDARDPQAPPTTVPVRSPPVAFQRELTCDFTASPAGDRVVHVSVTIAGTIQ
jgi:hypothetical protein